MSYNIRENKQPLYDRMDETNKLLLETNTLLKQLLNKKSLELLKISYPLIEKQQEIVNFCEQNDELIKQLENEIERNKKEAKQYLTDVLQSVELEQNEIIDKFESEEDDEEDED